jgi:hypothetical protein
MGKPLRPGPRLARLQGSVRLTHLRNSQLTKSQKPRDQERPAVAPHFGELRDENEDLQTKFEAVLFGTKGAYELKEQVQGLDILIQLTKSHNGLVL